MASDRIAKRLARTELFVGEDHSTQLARLAAIIESSDDAIVSKSLEGIIQSWNGGAVRIFGYTAEEAVGKPITIIIPPELLDEERRILEQLRKGERIDHFDTVRVTKDGRRIPISLTISPIRNSRGVIVGASKVARDISERRRAEALLAAEAETLAKLNELGARLWRMRTLSQGLDEILAAVIELLHADMGHLQLLDATGDVLEIAAHRGFGTEFLEACREIRAGDDSVCSRALRLGMRIVIEDVEFDPSFAPWLGIARKAGFRAIVSTPLMAADGMPLGVVSAHCRSPHRPTEQELRRLDLYLLQVTDFIQRSKMEQAVRSREEALQEADRRKDEFLALLAHELRNPLAPIRYALAGSRKGDPTPEQRKRVEQIIERQVAHMSRLLDDLLDVSRITRGTFELKTALTELAGVLGAAIETARPLLDTKRHTLAVDLPPQAVHLDADPVRLAQVFSNLLINAAKYTAEGGCIRLEAAREADEVVIIVRDNGVGISADVMPRLFTMFSQAPTALAHAEGGLGIGLALVRGIVTLHGGTIEARSDGPGRGSEFIVRLPAQCRLHRDVEPATETAAVTSPRLRVLIVDDNRDSAESCGMMLEFSGHHVEMSYTGRAALELARTFNPHAILLDIGLPDLDGYAVAKRLRRTPWGRAATLIAVTGWGQEEARRRAFEAGFDHHLTKPVSLETVESVLRTRSAVAMPQQLAGG